jgi:putative hydrolase of the HAD superfamily
MPRPHIVFDFAGVLFQWSPTRLLQREVPHVASSPESAAALAAQFFQGYNGDWADFDRGTVDVPELVQRIAGRTGLAAADVQRVVDGVALELQPIPETVALLQRLRAAGRGLHFLSNMPRPYADHLEARHDFIGWFASGVYSGREGLIKPEAAIFELAVARFGQPASNLVFLDDHLPNVQAAQACGWQALHFSNAAQAEDALRQNGWL